MSPRPTHAASTTTPASAMNTQSLPSFAHTFSDIPDIPRSQFNKPSPRQQNPPSSSSNKRRHDAITQSDTPNEPQAISNRHHKRLKSPSNAVSASSSADSSPALQQQQQQPRVPHLVPLRPSPNGPQPQPILARPSPSPPPASPGSPSSVLVKEEDPESDQEPDDDVLPPVVHRHIAHAHADSPTFVYPRPVDNLARKRRRVTISGANPHAHAHLANNPHHHPPPSALSHSHAASPITPTTTVSPVVMGFSVPRTPQGVPHKQSVDQVRSALSLKQQQKALIEARKSNPNATAATLPTPPITAPSAVSGPSSSATDASTLPPSASKRLRHRAATVTTGTAVVSPLQPHMRAGDYVRESTRPINDLDQDSTPHRMQMDISPQRFQVESPQATTPPSASAPSGSSLLMRRRGPAGTLGVNTSGISNAGSAANTADSSSSRTAPALTVRTSGFDLHPPSSRPVQTLQRTNSHVATTARPQPHVVPSQPRAAAPMIIPRNPMLSLDPIIQSAPLTVNGRMIISGRPPALGATAHRTSALSREVEVARSPSRHHTQLFGNAGASGAVVRAQPQVPISATLRTPHVATFNIPSRPQQGMAIPADKQSFLNLFGQFYDSLNDAKHLKTWLEGQVAKSDALITSLERAVRDGEAERARIRAEADAEVGRLKSRLASLENRLARMDAEQDGQQMDVDRQESFGRTRSGSTAQRQPPLPSIATFNGDGPGRNSRRGSIVALSNLPPPPRSAGHPNALPPLGANSKEGGVALPPIGSLSSGSSRSPQELASPGLLPVPATSNERAVTRKSPLNGSVNRGSPLTREAGRSQQSSPSLGLQSHRRPHIVARPTPTPSPPPPPRLVGVAGGRASAA